jgi:hypothetical protein
MDRPDRQPAWLLFSPVVIFVALPTAYAVSRALLGTHPAAAGTSIQRHGVGLAITMLLFALLGATGVVILRRALLGPVRRRELARVLVTASVAGVAGFVGELAIVGWGIERFGEQGADPDLLREAAFVPILTVLTGLAGSMRALAARGTPRRLTTALTVAMAGLVVAMVLLNVPGAFDGIGPGGTGLGIGLASMAIVVLGIAVASLRSPASQDPERKTSPIPGS